VKKRKAPPKPAAASKAQKKETKPAAARDDGCEETEELSKLKVAELKVRLKARGLSMQGRHEQLVERLKGSINAEKEAAGTGTASATVDKASTGHKPAMPPPAAKSAAKPMPIKATPKPTAPWPGGATEDWLLASSGALSPDACAYIGRVFAQYDVDADGGLSRAELNAFNRATGSDELDDEDLQFLLGSFENHAASGGLSAKGFEQYHKYALEDDFDSAIHDLRVSCDVSG